MPMADAAARTYAVAPAPRSARPESRRNRAPEGARSLEAGGSTAEAHCRHCAQPLLHSVFRDARGAVFCCEGCRLVHGVLEDNNWDFYYDLLNAAGRQAPGGDRREGFGARLAELDDPERLKGMGRWRGDEHEVVLESPDISCAACSWLLEKALYEAGALDCRVDFLKGSVSLRYDARSRRLRELAEKAALFGYRLLPASPGSPGDAARVRDRDMLMRLAVAGACFANIMSFSLAGYFGLFSGIAGEWTRLFGWYSFALSLPVVTYCALPFYRRAWHGLRMGSYHLDTTVSLGILLTFGVSAISSLGGEAGHYLDSVSGLVFFLLAGRWAVRRLEGGLAFDPNWSLRLPEGKARVENEGRILWEEAGKVPAGADVRVLAGEFIPLDGLLLSDRALIDASLLTGEDRPVQVNKGEPLFAGGLNRGESLLLKVTAPHSASRVEILKQGLEDLLARKKGRPGRTEKAAAVFTGVILFCAAAAFSVHLSTGGARAISIAASVLIVSCSCAFALAVPINLGLGLKRARGRGFHFRDGEVLRRLAGIRCVLFDKTGTLTFTRRRLRSWRWTDARGPADASRHQAALPAVRALARASIHPVCVTLYHSLEAISTRGVELEEVREILHFGILGRDRRTGKTICLCRFGAWEDPGSGFAELGFPDPRPALAGLAMEGPETALFVDGDLAALIGYTEEMKPGIAGMPKDLERLGVRPVLLSGDRSRNVEAFASAAGFRHRAGGLAPEEKRAEAARQRRACGPSLAVGDGFNDSLMFGEADAALAMGGTAGAMTAGADVLASADDPAAIPGLLRLARAVEKGIRLSYGISFSYNIAALTLAFQGLVTPLLAAVLMPLSSLSLVLAAWLRVR